MHLYDTSQIRSHLNPPKSVYPQAQSITYIDPKFIQLRIYYKCESEFLVRKRPVNKVAHMTLR